MDTADAVAGEEEGLQARGEGEVGEGGDVVVGEVDGVLVLLSFPIRSSVVPREVLSGIWQGRTHFCNTQILNGWDFVSCTLRI